MKNVLVFISLLAATSVIGFGQDTPASKTVGNEKSVVAVATLDTPLDLAKSSLAAHGGDKLKQMKTLVMKGSADVNSFNQSIPASFVTIISGDKYYYEINNPFQPLKQIYDGRQVFSSIQGFSLPPITSLGFPLLPKVGDAGYVVSALVDVKGAKTKRKGFRITSPEGFYTDFFVDEKTKQIKGYESSYDVGGRTVTTSVEIDEFQTIDGVIVPKKYSQRFDLGQMTAYANFKAKEILINSEVKDEIFAMPK